MIVTMVMVASLNGKITKGNNPSISSWASKEDRQHFLSILANNPLRVMGRKTYEGMKQRFEFKKNIHRFVLTHHPEKFEKEIVPGQLEFTDESPEQLVSRLTKEGHKTLLVLGGGTLNTEFFKKKLVDELIITVEPKLFGTGMQFISESCPDIDLRLQEVRQLNTQGTLLLLYRIKK